MTRAAFTHKDGTRDKAFLVAISMDHTDPIITTKRIAASLCPNHNRASGVQQTEGKA